jgi:hypothetical protein
VLANHHHPYHAIKIIQELRNTFVHSAESLEQNMTSVADLTAWINQQCAQIDTDQYAENLANNPDQQLKCLLGDALLQYSQLVSAVMPIAAEPSPVQQNLNHSSSTNLPSSQCRSSVTAEPDSPNAKPPQLKINHPDVTAIPSVPITTLRSTSSTAFAQQQKSRVVDGSDLYEARTVNKTTDDLKARHNGEDNHIGRQLSIHAKAWTPSTPRLFSTAASSSTPSTSCVKF